MNSEQIDAINELKWGGTFEKTESLVIAEKIYELKNEKSEAKRQLDSEEFHLKYIPKRLKAKKEAVVSRLKFLLPTTIVMVSALIGIVVALVECIVNLCLRQSQGFNEDLATALAINGFTILGNGLIIIFFGPLYFKELLLPEIRDVIALWEVPDSKKSKYKDKYSFQDDEEQSQKKIEFYKEKIANCEKEIEELTRKQVEMFQAQKELEEHLGKDEILPDEKPSDIKQTKLSLKVEKQSIDEINIINEFYQTEFDFQKKSLADLENKILRLNRELFQNEEDYEKTIKIIGFTAIIFVFTVLVQNAFKGFAASVTSLICLVIFATLLIQFKRKYLRIIVLHLVENDSELTKEYAFCNTIIPVYARKKEVEDEKISCENRMKALIEQMDILKKQKEELEKKG